ncbi:type VII secretion-associated protein [Corynebacterium sp. TAE3-ERU30]|uniref:type VII secretion-associated protein n=1 Tax=Corynebacterium sp. TAE3-ERU30 TaxID=2849496 RepID=UPI001C4412B1|nr:type VII secretion-associated protein [Corynebacterium sp. TAE3-ERU30]
MMPRWEVSVTDALTIVVEATTAKAHYFYDLGAAALSEPDQARRLVSELRDLTGSQWPQVEVIIDAAEEPGECLLEQCHTARVRAWRYGEPPPEPAEPTEPTAPAEVPAPNASAPRSATAPRPEPEDGPWPQPPQGVRRRSLQGGGIARLLERVNLFSVAIVAVVLLVVGVSWWSTRQSLEPAPVRTVAEPEQSSSSPPPSDSAGEETSTSAEAPREIVVERGPVRVRTPEGFEISDRGDSSFQLNGADPELRILISFDEVYSVSAAAVIAEIESMVAVDETLRTEAAVFRRHGQPAQTSYVEEPGDGSVVRWTAWVEQGTLISVGCHSRHQPSHAHTASCRMAVDSLEHRDNTTGDGEKLF